MTERRYIRCKDVPIGHECMRYKKTVLGESEFFRKYSVQLKTSFDNLYPVVDDDSDENSGNGNAFDDELTHHLWCLFDMILPGGCYVMWHEDLRTLVAQIKSLLSLGNLMCAVEKDERLISIEHIVFIPFFPHFIFGQLDSMLVLFAFA